MEVKGVQCWSGARCTINILNSCGVTCITVLVIFYRLFYYFKYHGLLNPIDNFHIFALHYIYLPRINESLLEFKDAWNSHKVRTEQGLTPAQLFTSGALRLQESGPSALDFFDRVTVMVWKKMVLFHMMMMRVLKYHLAN